MYFVRTLFTLSIIPVSLTAADSTWDGWSVGGQLGYARAVNHTTVELYDNWITNEPPNFRRDVAAAWKQDRSFDALPLSLEVGYLHRVGERTLIGATLEAAWIGAEDSYESQDTVGLPTFTSKTTLGIDGMAALRPEIGLSLGRQLCYITGGIAIAEINGEWEVLSSNNYSKAGSASDTLLGWQFGFGFRHAVSDQIQITLEYLFTEFEALTYETQYRPGSLFPGYSERINQVLGMDTLRVGIRYQF